MISESLMPFNISTLNIILIVQKETLFYQPRAPAVSCFVYEMWTN